MNVDTLNGSYGTSFGAPASSLADLSPGNNDPIKVWVAWIMNRGGGHLSILGIPAVLASVAFMSRILWLKRNRVPHLYGRTRSIYWSTQLLLGAGFMILLGLLGYLATVPDSSSASHGLFAGAICLTSALLVGLVLNKFEHRYEVRSSDLLFLFYLVTLLTSSVSLYILASCGTTDQSDAGKFLWAFLVTIGLAMFIEAFPRSNTHVQIKSREQGGLSAFDQANLISRWLFHYIQPIVSLGATRPLTAEDLDDNVDTKGATVVSENMKTKPNYEAVSASWERELREKKNPSLLLSVLRAYRGKIVVLVVIRVIGYVFAFLPPVLFSQLLQFFTEYHSAASKSRGNSSVRASEEESMELSTSIQFGLLIVAGMLVCNLISSSLLAHTMKDLSDLGVRARAGVIAMVYRKSLKLSPEARQKATWGEITNHMAVDAEKWISASVFLPMLITIPIELIMGTILLYRNLGWSLVAGIAVFAVITPIQGRMAAFMNGFQDKKLGKMDSRLGLMTEIVSNIRVIKLSGWEDAFLAKVNAIRDEELRAEKMLATIRSMLVIVFSSVTLLMALATFAVFATVGGPNMTPGKMTPEVIFVSIALFGQISGPLGRTTFMISQTISIRVANRRIQTFLLQKEMDASSVSQYGRPNHPSPKASGPDASVKGRPLNGGPLSIEIEDGTFSWTQDKVSPADDIRNEREDVENDHADENQPLLSGSSSGPAVRPLRPVLSDVNLQVSEGSLTAIVGRIGQGKSSLLSAILGELHKQQGSVRIYGDLAYVPQQAWIINATLRDNIILGRPFVQDKYNRIVFACGLEPDLEMLPASDLTEIGERGINLSGGQKQRVSLARAAYLDSDVYLLDDPLSAVDAQVDQHLWRHLIGPQGLLRTKTRVLVTHGIQHLEEVNQVVVLKDGRILEQGGYRELLKMEGAFFHLMKEFSVGAKRTTKTKQGHGDAGEEDESGGTAEKQKLSEGGDDGNDSGDLIEAEEMVQGKVAWRIAKIYARAASYSNMAACISLFAISQAVHISTNLWLRHWITDTEASDRDPTIAPKPVSYYLLGYGVLVVIFMALDVACNYTNDVICGIQAAKTLHRALVSRVLRLPMSFFDTTPMGRIIQRFSSDMEAIDSSLPDELNQMFAFSCIILGTLSLITYSTPAFLIIVPLLGWVYFLIQDYFIKTSGSLRRLYSVAKSPLYQHFSETLSGVTSIRATRGLKDMFIQVNDSRSDVLVKRMNIQLLVNRWLQIRLEFLGAFTIFAAATLAVLNADRLDPSLVGLALSYALSLIVFINMLVRTVSEVQNLLVSVERVQEYSEKTPTEAAPTCKETNVLLPENWPSHGRIVFKNYSTRYREGLDLVLRDVSFAVEPGQKVAIVGRTGAGKSSLTLALFRIIEAAVAEETVVNTPDSSALRYHHDSLRRNVGSIEIDGVDISTLGLNDLRRRLSIIPQDPTLFVGTIRSNLDPFDKFTDAELWQALERAHVKAHISSLQGGLSYQVSENGGNFSVGQRALLCLARALLCKTKVLVLDEATAAVDVETDKLIQKTIRIEFKDRTILTIAHRIKTVMDSDKILVLEKGKVKEFDTPETLLKNRDSLFYGLAHQAGEV
ncbi:hypothetical protein BGX31_003156 [Mortierella sp. GBA43]|nr:hypothetical protein BGX31_003156 [Mortierella sp. GBA43]